MSRARFVTAEQAAAHYVRIVQPVPRVMRVVPRVAQPVSRAVQLVPLDVQPVYVSQVGRKIALVALGGRLPVADDYHAINSSGASSFELVWQPEQVKHDCHLITWFLNNRGKGGPESLPLVFTII